MSATNKISSPLRYPGGKSKISPFLVDLLLINNLENCNFHELYAGGAGAALDLLLSNVVKNITLNDLDPHIYSFWKSILDETDQLLKLIHDTSVNIENWKSQRQIYLNYKDHSPLEIGFSTFYLNRCNRSGILYKAGPIGGIDQSGNYKIDARFNKLNLIRRIENIARQKSRITIKNEESIVLLEKIFTKKDDNNFVFLDPPYYAQGENLYLNFYKDSDHEKLRNLLKKNERKNWFLTYDNCNEINILYNSFRRADLIMSYSLQKKRKSKEVMVFSSSLFLPQTVRFSKTRFPLKLK